MKGETILQDRLVRVVRRNGKLTRVGKRVSKLCPLSPKERRVFVEQGSVMAIAYLMANRNLPIAQAHALLQLARHGNNAEWLSHSQRKDSQDV